MSVFHAIEVLMLEIYCESTIYIFAANHKAAANISSSLTTETLTCRNVASGRAVGRSKYSITGLRLVELEL